MRRRVAKGATEWRDATQQLSVTCVTAVTEANAAARAEAEGITVTVAAAAAAGAAEGHVDAAAQEDQRAVQDGETEQIRQGQVNGHRDYVYGTFLVLREIISLLHCAYKDKKDRQTPGQTDMPKFVSYQNTLSRFYLHVLPLFIAGRLVLMLRRT